MHVIAFDPYVATERYRELGAEQAQAPDDAVRGLGLHHLAPAKDTRYRGLVNAAVLAKCKDGVRILNVARGPLLVEEDLKAALDSGKVGGAALTCSAPSRSPSIRCSATRT